LIYEFNQALIIHPGIHLSIYLPFATIDFNLKPVRVLFLEMTYLQEKRVALRREILASNALVQVTRFVRIADKKVWHLDEAHV
jgi:hypothetical protein